MYHINQKLSNPEVASGSNFFFLNYFRIVQIRWIISYYKMAFDIHNPKWLQNKKTKGWKTQW